MTWVIVMLYFNHMADSQFIGKFATQQGCLTAMIKANPEVKPDAMTCIKLDRNQLIILEQGREQQRRINGRAL